MSAAQQLGADIGIAPACRALGVHRSTFYRKMKPTKSTGKRESTRKRLHPRALCPKEKDDVLRALNSDRFMNESPREVYATLLDEGKYLCSVRTMYRILGENDLVRE